MNINNIDTCIFHKGCFDGIACILVIYKYYLENKFKIPTIIGVHAGDKDLKILNPNTYKKKNVIIMDVAFDKQIILKLKNECNNLLIVDHHISNYNILKDLEYCKFDLNKSASRMIFEMVYPDKEIPLFILKIEDIDIMKINPNCEDSNEFYTALQVKYQKYMNIEKGGLNFWMELYDEKIVDDISKIGIIYLQYKNFIIENNNKFYKKVELLSHPHLKVSCFIDTHIVGLSSDLLHSIEDKCDIAMLYRFMYNKNSYLITMRTNKNINLVELFGDKLAGHSKAVSGFVTDINKFLKIIN